MFWHRKSLQNHIYIVDIEFLLHVKSKMQAFKIAYVRMGKKIIRNIPKIITLNNFRKKINHFKAFKYILKSFSHLRRTNLIFSHPKLGKKLKKRAKISTHLFSYTQMPCTLL